MERLDLAVELERHHPESYGWALNCCARDASVAEDVLHDAYQKILDGRARYDGRSSFKTWLFGVIRITAAQERRRGLLRRLRLVSHANRLEKTDPADRPDDCLCRAEIQSRVRHALAALPKRQREVLLLVFYHDLSLSQAGGVMGVSVGSARRHYERGKAKLRRWLLSLKAGIGDDERTLARTQTSAVVP